MDGIEQATKAFLLPGSAMFLLIGVSAGVIALHGGQRAQRWARLGLIGLAALYWVLSMPLMAGLLERGLAAGFAPIQDAAQAEGASAVVVLAGGTATVRASDGELNLLSEAGALRVLETARLVRLLDIPWVIASGGRAEGTAGGVPESLALREALVRAGVPEDRILLESGSRDTHEQALAIGPILDGIDAEGFILVTSPAHMRRAVGAFRAAGLDPIPSVSAQHSEARSVRSNSLIPSGSALNDSMLAAREAIAWLYYGLRGWLSGK